MVGVVLHSEESEEVQYTLYPAMFAGSLGGLHDTFCFLYDEQMMTIV